MPILPPTPQTPPTYPSDRADLWAAVRALEQRLRPAKAEPAVKPGVVTSTRPSVRVLGESQPRDVWRVTSGAVLEVGQEVACVDTALGLVVLSAVVAPVPGPYVPPPAPGGILGTWLPDLVDLPADTTEAREQAFIDAGWWSDADGPSYNPGVRRIDEWYYGSPPGWWGQGPVAPYNSAMLEDNSSPRKTPIHCAPCAAGTGAEPVTAGHTYSDSVYVCVYDSSGAAARVGFVWYDASGAALGTDYGASVTVGQNAYPWYEGYDLTVWAPPDYPPDYYQARPQATLTAPAGAAYAQPIVEMADPGGGHTWWVSAWEMAAA